MLVHGVILKDKITVELFDSAGGLKALRIADMIVSTGRQAMALAVGTTRGTPGASWIALGSSIVANQGTRTRLLGERAAPGSGGGPGRLYGSFTRPTSSFYFRRQRTWQAGSASGSNAETGLFIQSTSNTGPLRNAGGMLNRGTFATIVKGASDTLRITHQVSFGTS